MFTNDEILEAGNVILRSYVSMKSGDLRTANKLFNSLKDDNALDPIMDGIAKAMTRLKAEEEEVVEEDNDNDDDEEEVEDNDNDDEEAVEETIDVPASVAAHLNLI